MNNIDKINQLLNMNSKSKEYLLMRRELTNDELIHLKKALKKRSADKIRLNKKNDRIHTTDTNLPLKVELTSIQSLNNSNWKSDIKDIKKLIEELVIVTKRVSQEGKHSWSEQQGSDASGSDTVAPHDNDAIESISST